ncbi:MAG: M23 family metallopeptidase [Candidatus Margulisiibacteriota bacterium]|jgi:murein DD-endopeptidase MepM/ murein hydrolase activator NlpD
MKYLIFILLVAISTFSSALEMVVERSSVTQGEVIPVYINTVGKFKSQKLFFSGREYPLFTVNDSIQRALVATDLGTKPKAQTIFFKAVKLDGREIALQRTVTVNKGDFPYSIIQIPKAQKKLASVKLINDEGAIIGGQFRGVSPTQLWDGTFVRPVQGLVTTPYGASRIYDNGKLSWWHKGVDIGAKQGVAVLAPNGGRVVLSQDLQTHGKTIIIDHGQSVFSIFNHMSKRDVPVGKKVLKGEKIGEVGATGIATGPHLHWGLSVSNVRVNPLVFLSVPEESPR